ncbi:MAG: hypothetical protein M3Y87_26945, partial [Myxococcota bacterium]|nr:hypothetical protein [Myxococcota bacterium]
MSAVSLVDGLALAATLKADRDGVAARHGLTPDLAEALEERIRAVRALPPRERERALATVIAALRAAVPETAVLPPRAAAMLAT